MQHNKIFSLFNTFRKLVDNTFSGYLPVTEEEINKLIIEGNIVFDSSSIFNLYRYQSATYKEVIVYLNKIKKRLHLPYMVGLEYHNNRAKVLSQQRAIYLKLNSKASDLKNSISEHFLNEQHSSVSFEEITKIVDNFEESLRKYLKECESKHPNYLKNDPIRTSLVKLFSNQTGLPIDELILKDLYKTAEQRFDKNIPPGYKDLKNKNGLYKVYGNQAIESKYSDFIIWHEILELGKRTENSTLLISDEQKEDWCWKEQGYILGPRPELITEYRNATGSNFYMLNLNDFLNKVKDIEQFNISEEAIADIKSNNIKSWKDEVFNAVNELGGTVTLQQLYKYIATNSNKNLTKEWRSTVRKAIYLYCEERDMFLGKEILYKALSKSKYRIIDM